LRLVIDPNTNDIKAYYKIGMAVEFVELAGAGAMAIPAVFLSGRTLGSEDPMTFAGVFASYRNGSTFDAEFDYFTVREASDATDILTFTLPEETGGATVDAGNHTVAIEVANGTDVADLTPAITISAGATISPASNVAGDFSAPVTYTVTAEDGTTQQDWTVTVTEAPSDATDIETFTLNEATGPATINTTAHTVAIEVTNGTDVMDLSPTIMVSEGATISPISGASQDFSTPFTYTVTAEDGTTQQDWEVTVIEASSTATDILNFTLNEETGAAAINSNDHTVTIEVANGTVLTALSPTITVSTGATINPESETAQDFSTPFTYTVTAEDGTTQQDWTVTVTEAPSDATDIE
ncbi:MAG: DUF5018 domain-containing protein, partial [Bacteroidota bacterium]